MLFDDNLTEGRNSTDWLTSAFASSYAGSRGTELALVYDKGRSFLDNGKFLSGDRPRLSASPGARKG
jgi:hypothetical protein